MQFIPCSSCARHVKHSEVACPFCCARVIASVAGPEGRVARDRTALLFGAAAIAGTLAVAGCNNNATTDGTGAGATGMPTNATPSATAPTATTAPTHEPTGIVMPYGVPIPHDVDASPPKPASSSPADAGKPKPKQ